MFANAESLSEKGNLEFNFFVPKVLFKYTAIQMFVVGEIFKIFERKFILHVQHGCIYL